MRDHGKSPRGRRFRLPRKRFRREARATSAISRPGGLGTKKCSSGVGRVIGGVSERVSHSSRFICGHCRWCTQLHKVNRCGRNTKSAPPVVVAFRVPVSVSNTRRQCVGVAVAVGRRRRRRRPTVFVVHRPKNTHTHTHAGRRRFGLWTRRESKTTGGGLASASGAFVKSRSPHSGHGLYGAGAGACSR